MAIIFDPARPDAGEAVELAVSGSLGNTHVFALASVPAASALATGLILADTDENPDSAVIAASLGVQGSSFTPDVPGAYGVAAYSLRVTDGRFYLAGATTATLYVLETVDLAIVTTEGHGATLRLGVVDVVEDAALVGYVRAAELADHTTEFARVAALDSAVVAALAALVDTKVTVAGGDLITRAAELRTQFTEHIDVAAWHSDADVLNVPVRGAPASVADAIATLNELRTRFEGHARQSAQAGGWHGGDDTLTPVVVAQAFTLGQAQVLLSHLRALYETHRVRGSGVSVHANAGGDTTNTLAGATKLDEAISSYLSALSTSVPTAPAGEGQGAADASHRYGFAIRRPR